MAIQTATLRTTMATNYGTATPYMALFSTVPGASPGTELTGGAPAYARKASNWGTAAASAITAAPAAFDVASGSTVAGIGMYTAVTAGTYLDGTGVTSQAFSSQGQMTITATYTQS